MVTTRHLVMGAIGALVLSASSALAQTTDLRARVEAAIVRLETPITIEFTSARLEDALQFIAESAGVEIEALWRDDLHVDGLNPDALVSANVRAMSAELLLDRVLRQVVDDFDAPTWQIDPDAGAIQVGPRSRLNDYKRIEAYDLRDLLFVLPDFRNAPRLDMEAAVNQGDQGSGPGGGIFQDDEGDELAQPLPTEVADQIMETILEFVEPEQWTTNGGDGAQMRLMDQSLVVKAPGYVHRQLVGAGAGH